MSYRCMKIDRADSAVRDQLTPAADMCILCLKLVESIGGRRIREISRVARSGSLRGEHFLGRGVMHVITRKRLNDFAEVHPESRSALYRWYHLLKSQNVNSFAELREIFPNADQVGKFTVFNVGGNKVRLISAIHYNRRKVYIRAVLTHEEYNKSTWKE